jgi:predicted transcriptional regulator
LLDGRSHSAGDLAIAADISAQTASAHLAKLLDSRWVTDERAGRHRLFRIASPEVAHAVEAIEALAAGAPPRAVPELRFARMCYDHLAGMLAIALRDAMFRHKLMRHTPDEFALTRAGELWLNDFGVAVARLKKARRSFSRKCMDWTERDAHLGGSVGAALATRLCDLGWLARHKQGRAVRITAKGAQGLQATFGIRCHAIGVQVTTVPSTSERCQNRSDPRFTAIVNRSGDRSRPQNI